MKRGFLQLVWMCCFSHDLWSWLLFNFRQWWSKDTVAVVTGANKGIGLAIVRQLAKQGITVVLTARDANRAEQAIEALKSEGLDDRVVFHALDVSREQSAHELAEWLRQTYGGIDILVNILF